MNKRFFPHCLFLTFLFSWTVEAQDTKQVFGYLETVLLYPYALSMQAKLDTGADSSAVHATNITRTKKQGADWVSFDVVTKVGETLRLEKPVVRIAKIKRLSGPSEERPIILLNICLGTILREVEVGLVNRGHFDYRFLIGRNFLKDYALVDPSLQFTQKPTCYHEPR